MSEAYVREGKVKWIVKSSDVGVQERTLAPGDVVPWHYHTAIIDTPYCVEGSLQVDLLDPPEQIMLEAGQSYSITTGRPHSITGTGSKACRFLLIQGVGSYDRHAVDPTSWTPAAH